MELDGKNAVVTGGSVGIGAAIAAALAREGANVAINYRKHDAEATEVVRRIESLGRKGLAIQADVTSFGDAQAMVDKAIQTFGRLDILVNNAGITRDSTVWKMTEEMWDQVIATNLKGYFNYIHAVAGPFKDQRYGRIVNITSINGMRGKFGQANYSASKGGIIALTKAIARELGKFNVTVNAVAPGLVATEMIEDLPREWVDRALAENATGRLASPEDVADVVVFLASERSRCITGEVINASCGQYM